MDLIDLLPDATWRAGDVDFDLIAALKRYAEIVRPFNLERPSSLGNTKRRSQLTSPATIGVPGHLSPAHSGYHHL